VGRRTSSLTLSPLLAILTGLALVSQLMLGGLALPDTPRLSQAALEAPLLARCHPHPDGARPNGARHDAPHEGGTHRGDLCCTLADALALPPLLLSEGPALPVLTARVAVRHLLGPPPRAPPPRPPVSPPSRGPPNAS